MAFIPPPPSYSLREAGALYIDEAALYGYGEWRKFQPQIPLQLLQPITTRRGSRIVSYYLQQPGIPGAGHRDRETERAGERCRS